MGDFPIQDTGEVKYPKRRPWLVLLVGVIVAGLVIWWQGRAHEETPAGPPPAPMVVSGATNTLVVPPAVVPRPSTSGQTSPAGVVQASGSVAGATGNVVRVLQEARAAESRASDDSGALAAARKLYLAALRLNPEATARAGIEKRLGEISVQLALTPLPMPDHKVDCVVKSGESIDRIAKRLGTTTKLIERSNQIANPNRIKVGDHFRILTGKFALEVNKSTKEMVLTLDGEFFKRYLVGTGKFGKTPVGTFEIYDKIPEPVWWRPDGKEVPFGNPENILGTRWMAIRAKAGTADVRGYGIHGTWFDDSIGKAESAGCIRMHNPDVEELFDLLPLGTVVTIVE